MNNDKRFSSITICMKTNIGPSPPSLCFVVAGFQRVHGSEPLGHPSCVFMDRWYCSVYFMRWRRFLDSGDCGKCTCSRDCRYPCGYDGFDCLDPSVSSATNECQNTTSNVPVCSTEYASHNWIVKDTVWVRFLAEKVSCTSGTFNVTWKRKVTIDRTFYVAEDTTVHLIGADSGSKVDGGGSIRTFTLVNANLHVVCLTLSNGYATYGGAIATAGLTLNNNNIASTVAGALYLDVSSLFVTDVQMPFYNNTALHGRELCISAKVRSPHGQLKHHC